MEKQIKQIREVEKKIDAIKKKLSQLGHMRPGSLSKQYNVCGNPNCRCKDPENPRKHGPYYQLSYTHKGRSRSEFVKKENVSAVEKQLKNYQQFKSLTAEWIDLSIELAKLHKSAGK